MLTPNPWRLLHEGCFRKRMHLLPCSFLPKTCPQAYAEMLAKPKLSEERKDSMNGEAIFALGQWIGLSHLVAKLDARESECKCDVNEFHCCDLCREHHEKANEADRLMQLWCEVWATELSNRIIAQVQRDHVHDWRGIDTGRMCAICLEKEEL